ncbi:unnamed protein product [Ixodes hexagonus]
MISRQSRSPTGLLAVIFISLCSMGLILHEFTDGPLEQHYPTQLCTGAVQVIVAIRSAPGRYGTRQVIRKSIGNEATRRSLSWRIVFYMGFSRVPSTSHKLRREFKNDDIIVVPVPTSPLEAVPIFLETAKWLFRHCSAPYVIHVNDTTFPDLVGLHAYIENLSEEDYAFHCSDQHSVKVDRDPANAQFYVSDEELKDTVFPTFCEGEAFLLRRKFLNLLVLAAEATPQYPLFSQYVTGQLAQVGNLGHRSIAGQMAVASGNDQWTERKLFVAGVTKLSMWKKYWMKMLVCYEEKNNRTLYLTEQILSRVQIKLLN